ncbi:NAD(P)-binding domain-containing protein [Chromobacterium piscinae]|uniref:NAD(P)-binding domain-containing protein n=1 Tax=Chromobacterium piscinae TaxID=686831 RepID=UPI00326019FA
MRIGYIGLGIMGRPCVLNLLKAGFDVSVWVRKRQSADDVLAAGAAWAASPAELAGQVDVLVESGARRMAPGPAWYAST